LRSSCREWLTLLQMLRSMWVKGGSNGIITINRDLYSTQPLLFASRILCECAESPYFLPSLSHHNEWMMQTRSQHLPAISLHKPCGWVCKDDCTQHLLIRQICSVAPYQQGGSIFYSRLLAGRSRTAAHQVRIRRGSPFRKPDFSRSVLGS